ncbi:MAG TPA: extracellular solute-binding protein [Kouleothrix sp.]|uniref:extracellular solute-binding protein n=1 Tax=Kouleothrix sp. TaxID=2779161 RepID=UPI002CF7D90A|nr:extracellular solute-binding protein [Kouleothrix sp.]HRC76253.1 extracellular solute-binding protein [Kouleothrix sp.]
MRRFASLFLLAALLLSACSTSPSPPDSTPQPSDSTPIAPEPTSDAGGDNGKVTISFAAWDYERQIYEPLAKKFSEENPNIEVVIVPLDDLMNVSGPNVDYSSFAQLRRVVAGADTAPSSTVAPETLGSSLMLDLTPHMDADSSFKRDDFYPGALEQYTIKGALRVLPRYVNVQLLSYNKDLFKNAGIPEPKLGWSWNDLLGIAEQMAKKNGSKVDTYGFLDSSGSFVPFVALLKEQGIDLLTADASKFKIDRPEIADALKRLRGLVDSGALFRPQYAPPVDGGKEPQNQVDPAQLIRDGKAAIWAQEFYGVGPGPRPVDVAGPNGGGGPTDTSLPFEVGSVPYPSSSFNFYSGVDGYIVSAGTAHPAESWKWIEFLSRQQTDQPSGGAPIYNQPGRIPARQSIAEQNGFWKNIDAQSAEAYKWALAHPAPPLERSPDQYLFGAFGQAIESALGAEKKDPAKALQEAQKQLDQQLADAQLTPTATPDLSPVAVATPEPQVAPEGATTIKFSSFAYNPADLRRIARSFRDQRPDIFVDVRSTDVFTQGPTLSQLAKTSDCFAWYSPPQTDDDFKGLLDLQPLFDADASFPQSDYSSALLAPYQRNGSLYGLPYAATLRTLNYNKTAFDAAGIRTPSAEWKPDDFLAAAQALTKGDGDKKQFGYVPLGGPQQDLFFFISQFGAQLVNGSGQDARPNFDDPKTVQAIQWYLDLSSVHKVMPTLKFPYQRDDNFNDQSYEYVQNGRAGMWFDQGYGMFGGPNGGGGGQGQQFEVGIAPLPIGGGGLRAGDMYLRGLHISAQSQQQQACWEWLKFLSADVTNLQGAIPARKSIISGDAFKAQASPDVLALVKAYGDVFNRSSAQASQGSDPSQIYNIDTYWFFKALSEALDKKATLAAGLAEAQKNSVAWLDCMAKTPNKPATCAQQVDPKYNGYNVEDPPADGSGPKG